MATPRRVRTCIGGVATELKVAMKASCDCLKRFKVVKKFTKRKPPLTNLMRSIPAELQEKAFTEQQLSLIADQLLEWPHKAIGMGLSESDIENIKEDHKNSNKWQKIAMMLRWAELNGDGANLKTLFRISKSNDWEPKFFRKICEALGYGKQRGRLQLSIYQ